MNKIVIASTTRSAGKTSVAVGLAKASRKKIAYMKPFGDRLLYKKKLWDYDADLMLKLFGLIEKPEDITLGFIHSKMQYAYDEKKTKSQILKMVKDISRNKDVLFIEGGCDLSFGSSVHLDPIAVANYVGARMLLIADGSDTKILDDLAFIKKYLDVENVNLAGVIINKVKDVEDFEKKHIKDIEGEGIVVFGVLPYKPELTYMPVKYLAEHLSARVIAGGGGLDKVIKNMFVADMSATAALQNPGFRRDSKMVVTSGSRTDTIIAAIENDTSCVVVADNIMPPSHVLSKASDADVPLLLVPGDAYHTVVQIEKIEPLLTRDDTQKIVLLEHMVKSHIDVKDIFG